MKKIENVHGATESMLTTGLKLRKTNKEKEVVVIKTICLPKKLHQKLNEIAFREEISMKQILNRSFTEFISSDDNVNEYDFSETVHPTFRIPKDVYAPVRQYAHTHHYPERRVCAEALSRYIERNYSKMYPDIFQ